MEGLEWIGVSPSQVEAGVWNISRVPSKNTRTQSRKSRSFGFHAIKPSRFYLIDTHWIKR